MFFIVVEIQYTRDSDLAPAVLTNSYTDYGQALNKYFTILAAAALSEVDKHGAWLISNEESLCMHQIIDKSSLGIVE